MPEPVLHTYDDVPISAAAFDAGDWANIPRIVMVDWLAIFGDAARVVAPEFVPPDLPEIVVFRHVTITSDGPYGSNENFYYLSHYGIELPGVQIYYEQGRQGTDDEPLSIETTAPGLNVSSWMSQKSPGRARFFLWHQPDQEPAVRAALRLDQR